jgi:hypothetical protein
MSKYKLSPKFLFDLFLHLKRSNTGSLPNRSIQGTIPKDKACAKNTNFKALLIWLDGSFKFYPSCPVHRFPFITDFIYHSVGLFD